MTRRVERAGLLVAEPIDAFVAHELLAGLEIGIDEFWVGFAALVERFHARNAQLLARRDLLQQQLDGWHRDHGGPGKQRDYRAFLEAIGYLDPEPDTIVDTSGVDAELRAIAGPQLVVPLSNARYALNAANARWGSLYDVVYGTDVLGDTGAGGAYDPSRGDRVIAYVNELLDRVVPLDIGRYRDVVAFETAPGTASFTARYADGRTARLRDAEKFVGMSGDARERRLLLRNNGLHLELVVDPSSRIGRQHHAGLADVVLESAVTTIQDVEDSVAAVDADDKVAVYRNWLGLMRGTLAATFDKGGSQVVRRLAADRHYVGVDGSELRLPGRSLMLVRNVGLHMYTDALTRADGSPIGEGLLDAAITVAAASFDLAGEGRGRNSRTGSVYVVKPKLHGRDEVTFTVDVFAAVEQLLGLPPCTVKLGIMDEERRTSLNLGACIAAAADRVVFINTGFLDRTGDEIHTAMDAGPVLRKADLRAAPWYAAYERCNVDVGLRMGFRGVAQIGKGMWAMPDEMARMLSEKGAHPDAGASCAWVPSPTAATLHATHYHLCDVDARQRELSERASTEREELLDVPLLRRRLSDAEIAEELHNDAQGILGYVVRWVDQGIGCSKVPDISGKAMMEDRATLRISSQLLANWRRHGIVDDEQLVAAFRAVAPVVDEQNAGDPAHRSVGTVPEDDNALGAAVALVLRGASLPNGYTEQVLHQWRRRVKAHVKATARDRAIYQRGS